MFWTTESKSTEKSCRFKTWMEFVRQILMKLKTASHEGLLMKVFSQSLMWLSKHCSGHYVITQACTLISWGCVYLWWCGSLEDYTICITWGNVDHDPCLHMASLGHNESILIIHIWHNHWPSIIHMNPLNYCQTMAVVALLVGLWILCYVIFWWLLAIWLSPTENRRASVQLFYMIYLYSV